MKINPAKVPYYDRENYSDEILLVDGITRSGKFMLSQVISAFEGVEYFHYSPLIEWLVVLTRFGRMDGETCRLILQMDTDLHTYDRMVGRYLNGRKSDLSCVTKSLQAQELLARAENDDEQALVDDFLARKNIPQYLTHEGFCNLPILFDVFPKSKIVHVLRDPVILAHSWFKRGWGSRFGNDPKAVCLAFKKGGGNVPWFAVEWERDYHKLSEMERVVFSLESIFRIAEESYAEISEDRRARVLFVTHDAMISDPMPTVRALEKFIGARPLPGMGSVLERERLPRADKGPDREALLSQFAGRISDEALRSLHRLAGNYDGFWKKLSVG